MDPLNKEFYLTLTARDISVLTACLEFSRRTLLAAEIILTHNKLVEQVNRQSDWPLLVEL